MDTQDASRYLDLYDYRRQVSRLYQRRNAALANHDEPESVALQFRADRDHLFAAHSQSALDVRQKQAFRGLDYFPYDRYACISAEVDDDVEPRRMVVHTSSDETMQMVLAAKLRFTLFGNAAELSMYWIDVYGGGLFLPFADAGSSIETYGGGRYLFDTVKGSDFLYDAGQGGAHHIQLDFNYAYNPSCAYNPRWVCPLAPPENRLPFPTNAGEKRFS